MLCFLAEIARHAFTLVTVDCGAKLGRSGGEQLLARTGSASAAVTVVVSITVRTEGGHTMEGALLEH
jgi:hypothetical protein